MVERGIIMKLSKRAATSLNRVINKFKLGDLSDVVSVARMDLAASAPAKKWSFCNKVLAYSQSGDLDCRGFRQWQKVGRKVKKGSRAVYIFCPHLIKLDQKEKDSYEDKAYCTGFSVIPVFASTDTKGDTKLPVYQPKKLPPLYTVAKYLAIDVNYLPVGPDKLGDCNSVGSRIRLGSKDTSVFFHELGHAIHANLTGKLSIQKKVEQEVIAEFTATVLMDLYGIRDHSGNAWQYIKHYASNPLIAISKALATVEKILAVIEQAELAIGSNHEL